MDILLQGHFFEKNADTPRTRKSLLFLLEALVQMNRQWLNFHPNTPLLYEAGVEYITDPFNEDNPAPHLEEMQKLAPGTPHKERKLELWSLIPNIMQQGGSDCKNLTAWRCAELRQQGIHCRPFFKWKDTRDYMLYHVIVEYPNPETGRYSRPGERTDPRLMEDPSKILGMGRNGR